MSFDTPLRTPHRGSGFCDVHFLPVTQQERLPLTRGQPLDFRLDHAEDLLPFSISKTPMCCVAHVASDMGSHVPVWDIEDKFGDATNLLVINMEQGRDMAKKLGQNAVVLMRGHGATVVGESLPRSVGRSVYLEMSAKMLHYRNALGR